MTTFLVIVGGAMLLAYRVWGKVGPTVRKVWTNGPELTSWNLFFEFGGPRKVGKAFTTSARMLLWFAFAVAAMLNGTVRWALVVVVAVTLWRRSKGRRVAAAEFARSGFESTAERKLIHEATTQALLSMGLGKQTRNGVEQIPPTLARWRKLPVMVGGKPVAGHWRFVCRAEPAPGQGLASITSVVGRGLDGVDDRLRDAVQGTLRVARGREVAQLRKRKLVPQIVFTTAVPVANRNGEMTGQLELSLWTTDPFRQPVSWQRDSSKPVVRSIDEPAPIGLLRSNAEAKVALNLSTGIMGTSGSGKSSVLRPMLIAAAHTDAIIICITLKGPRDYLLMRERFAGGVIIDDPKVAANVVRWYEGEIRRRNGLDSAELAKLPDIILLCDEAHELAGDIALMISPVKLGRSARCWSWLATQYAPSGSKPEDGGFPTTLGRELGQRLAGRIEGNHAQAEVAVGQRASKNAGPHLIPAGKAWAGVLFDNDGRYVRAYWTDPEDESGPMAQCAASCGPRPDDPPGFVDALHSTTTPQQADVTAAPQWPADGTRRNAAGEAISLLVAELPDDVLAALAAIKSKPRSNQRTISVDHVRQLMAGIDPDNDEQLQAAALLDRLLAAPIPATSTTEGDS